MSSLRSIEDIPRIKLEEHAASPAFLQRWRPINVVSILFVVAPFVYLGLLVSGTLQASVDCSNSAAPLWPVLWILSIFSFGPLVIVTRLLLRKAQRAGTFGEASTSATSAVVIPGAFGEVICVYALVGPFLCMPMGLCYALWGFGLVSLVGSLLYTRGKAREIMIVALAREQEAAESRGLEP